ncbi:hypothetical protein O181_126995 [Austropuccinia psidii MF-1]|uniref:Uncharacterized protein n=1 Tax=Austropuccinia psidii MF-1 TaxID=1389203 RepID=A0A9Q3KSD0_9BASI|nr:hypothetical protein [Austropuccinia psidii MF-1]
MPPLKASKVKVHTPLGLNSSPRASPATLGGQDLDGPGPHQWVQAMYGEFYAWAISGPLGHPGSPANLGPGAPFWSWGPPLTPTDRGVRSTDHGPRTIGP